MGMGVKMTFFRLFAVFILILRSFYIIYVEISCRLIVPLRMIFLPYLAVFLLSCWSALAQEALVIVAGFYPDGYEDNEVEVWSHSADCGLSIAKTPDSFIEGPAVGLYEKDLYVCGGHRIGTSHKQDTCDVYSTVDDEWREGPALKFNTSTDWKPHPLSMVAIGSKLVAFNNNHEFSILEGTEWSEPASTNIEEFCYGWAPKIVAYDNSHVAKTCGFGDDVYFFNVETASITATVHFDNEDFSCESAVMYNNTYTCLLAAGAWIEHENLIYSLTFDEGFTDPTWSVLDVPPYTMPCFDDNTGWEDYRLTVLDGMLTVFCPKFGTITYLEEGEWKEGFLEILRREPASIVMPCN